MQIEYLSDEFTTVKENDSALDVTKKLTKPKILTAIVLDENERIVGAIIKNSLLDECIIKGRDPKEIKAKELMDSIDSIEENTEFIEAVRQITDNRAKALAILNNGKLKGVLSVYDALSLLYKIQTHKPNISLPEYK